MIGEIYIQHQILNTKKKRDKQTHKQILFVFRWEGSPRKIWISIWQIKQMNNWLWMSRKSTHTGWTIWHEEKKAKPFSNISAIALLVEDFHKRHKARRFDMVKMTSRKIDYQRIRLSRKCIWYLIFGLIMCTQTKTTLTDRRRRQ